MNYHIFYRGCGENSGVPCPPTEIPSFTTGRISSPTEGVLLKTSSIGFSASSMAATACSWLPENTPQRLWVALVGMTGVAMCFAGYKVWQWVNDVSRKHREVEEERKNRYEYKYMDELDDLLQGTLDDVQTSPELADVDTIRVGGIVYPLHIFKAFSRNLRKKLVRKAKKPPVVKRVAIPASEFDWENTYVEDMVPVGTSRNPDDGKKVVMRYDPENESFLWFCDSSSVQYKYLETVARKYVCDFNRVDVFVDIRDELKKGAESKKDADAEKCGGSAGDENGKTESSTDDANCSDKNVSANKKKVYAKFKRYNKKTARADPNAGGKRVILKAKANRYTYKGKLCDYESIVGVGEGEGDGDDDGVCLADVGSPESHRIGDDVVVTGDDVNGHVSEGTRVRANAKAKAKVENVSWSEWKFGNFEGWR